MSGTPPACGRRAPSQADPARASRRRRQLLPAARATRDALRDDTFVLNAGDYVSLPKGVPHALRNVGAGEAVPLQTHDADSFLTFIRRVGIAGDQPPPDPASLDDAAMNNMAAETGQPVLGLPMSEDEPRAIIARG